MSDWQRVSSKDRCLQCKKGDWCTYFIDDKGLVWSCCMRTQSSMAMRNGGWLHRPDGAVGGLAMPIQRPQKPIVKPLAFGSMITKWHSHTTDLMRQRFADSIGVSQDSLNRMGAVFSNDDNAWAFPMRDENSVLIGIRFRNESGSKWAVTTSRNGLFIPRGCNFKDTLYIVEGPTDCAAACTLGWNAIGRPNCSANEDMIIRFINQSRARRVVIVPDVDEAGLRGADSLASRLTVPNKQFLPPAKDLREYVHSGGSALLAEQIMEQVLWKMP